MWNSQVTCDEPSNNADHQGNHEARHLEAGLLLGAASVTGFNFHSQAHDGKVLGAVRYRSSGPEKVVQSVEEQCKVDSRPMFEECICEVVRIGRIIISRLGKP